MRSRLRSALLTVTVSTTMLLATGALLAPGTALADTAVPARDPVLAQSGGCNLVQPVEVGRWDLNGDGAQEIVYFPRTAQGGWANTVVVASFASAATGGGCFHYPLESAVGDDPRFRYIVEAVQMDAGAGLELVVRPRPYVDGTTQRWSGQTRVIRHSERKWYLVDLSGTNQARQYQYHLAVDTDGAAGAELAALGRYDPPNEVSGQVRYAVMVFGFSPYPAVRTPTYPTTISDQSTSQGAVAPYTVLAGRLGGAPNHSVAVVVPPSVTRTGSWANGGVFIVDDRARSVRLGTINAGGTTSTSRFDVTSATITNGQVRVVVDVTSSGQTRSVVYLF